MSKSERAFTPLNVAVLTVSDTRTADNDTSGDLLQERLETAGHKIVQRTIHKDDINSLGQLFQRWIEDKEIDVIISTGGTGLTRRDITPEVVTPLITKAIPGFGELFRMLSYDDIGTSTIESRAMGGVADGTLIFCLPGEFSFYFVLYLAFHLWLAAYGAYRCARTFGASESGGLGE